MQIPPFSYPYTVKRSLRARHVRLVVSREGLVVVVPEAFCVSRDLSSLLESKKEWITKALSKVTARTRLKEATQGFPCSIDLRALGETWKVVFSSLTRDRLIVQEGALVLASDFNENEALFTLKRWLRSKACDHLPSLLEDLARELRFSFVHVTIKEQKTLWGSCSSKGNLNLNSRLLFLPPHLVRHVLLHELCHLKELNHSRSFHDLLDQLDPNATQNARELKEAWSYVPGWAL